MITITQSLATCRSNPNTHPPLQFLLLSLSAHALSYIDGNSEQALMGLCRDANTARVLLNDSNHLVMIMVGYSVLRRNLHVAAQIIAELPLETILPTRCNTAFASLTAQEINQSLCSGMRSEHAYMSTFNAH